MATIPTKYPWIHGFTTSGDLANLGDVVNSWVDAYGNPVKPGSIHLDFLEGSFDGKPTKVTVSGTSGTVEAIGSYYNNATESTVSATCVWIKDARGMIIASVKYSGGTMLAEVPLGVIVRGQMLIEVK